MMNNHGQFRGERGATIIAAMLIVALVTILSTHLIERQERWYRQVKLESDRLQATALANAAIDYGRAVLADDERRDTSQAGQQPSDHRDEAWARPLPPMSVEGGVLGGQIEDLQGKLNLNDLATAGTDPLKIPTSPVAAIARLWQQLDLDMKLLDALIDWQDADSDMRFPGGAEDQYYLALADPYRAANGPLSSLEELLRIRNFNTEIVERLRPHVTVLPAGTSLNVNTASAEVLSASIPGLALEDAVALRRSGDRKHFKSKTDFNDRLQELTMNTNPAPSHVDVRSSHFTVHGEVRWGEVSVRMMVGVKRQGNGASPSIEWKSLQ